jgi:hypothetical protein
MTYGAGGDRIELEILPEKRVIEGVETIIYLHRNSRTGSSSRRPRASTSTTALR